MIDSAIILAAGLGTRMKEFTKEIPKSLIKVNGKPMIDYAIEILECLKIKNIYINIHFKPEIITQHLKSKHNTNIIISDETSKLLDTGGGTKKIFFDHNLHKALVLNSDVIWDNAYVSVLRKMIKSFKPNSEALLGLVSTKLHRGYIGEGDFVFHDTNQISRFSPGDKAPYNYVGSQIITKDAFKDHKSEVFSINEVWDNLIIQKKLEGFKFDTNVLHVGTKETLLDLK